MTRLPCEFRHSIAKLYQYPLTVGLSPNHNHLRGGESRVVLPQRSAVVAMGSADAFQSHAPGFRAFGRWKAWRDEWVAMRCRFYLALWNGSRVLHIYHHDVVEREAYAVLAHPGEDLPGFDGSRMSLGQIRPHERFLRVIYIPEPEMNSAFVLTAFTLRGDVLRACRTRQRSRGQHRLGKRHRLQILERMSVTQPWQDSNEPPVAEQRFPPGWDEERALRVITHYERQAQDAQLAEDEAAVRSGQAHKLAEAEPLFRPNDMRKKEHPGPA